MARALSREQSDQVRAAVERLLDLAGESGARQILRGAGRPAALAELERVVVVRMASRLLAARAPRSAIRDRLVARGVSYRTAYRAIEAALEVVPSICASTGPVLAREVDTLPAPQPDADTTMDIDAIKRAVREPLECERATLAEVASKIRSQRVDLERAIVDAEKDVEASRPPGGTWTVGADVGPEGERFRASPIGRHEVAMRNLAGQRYYLRSLDMNDWPKMIRAEQRVREIDALLSCEASLTAAVAVHAATRDELKRLSGALTEAERVASSIEATLTRAQREAAEQCASAAAGLLSAVKAGATASIQDVDSSRLAIIDVALGEANAEVATARAAHDEANAKVAKARDEVARLSGLASTIHGLYSAHAVALASAQARRDMAAALAAQQVP